MSKLLLIFAATIFLTVGTVATALATISGAVGAVVWACQALGPTPVAAIGGFITGSATVHAVYRGLAHRRDR